MRELFYKGGNDRPSPVEEALFPKLETRLSPELLAHSLRVGRLAGALACSFGGDPNRAVLAGLVHDVARELPVPELIRKAREMRKPPDAVELQVPVLLHSRVGAWVAGTDFGINDPAVLKAIERHTTGAPGMDLLDAAVYMADLIEPGRDFPGVDHLRRAAVPPWESFLLEGIEHNLRYLVDQGRPIHPRTLETRNWLLSEIALRVRDGWTTRMGTLREDDHRKLIDSCEPAEGNE